MFNPTFTPFVCIKTCGGGGGGGVFCYSVNNDLHPKVADSLAF